MTTLQTSVHPEHRPHRSPLLINRLPGGSAKIRGFWVPPATLDSIDSPEIEGSRHDCMKRVGVCLSSQGMDANAILAVFDHMYGNDRGVGSDEMDGLARWCVEHPGEPCGGPEVVQRARQLVRSRGAQIYIGARRGNAHLPVVQASDSQAAENARRLLGDRLLRLDDLRCASPVPIHLARADLLASFGLLCSRLYRPEDRIVIVDRAFWPRHDFDGKWQPCGYGETYRARTWAEQFTPEAVENGCAWYMPEDARLTAEEKCSLDGSPAHHEKGISPLDANCWWASTRWGAWFRYNPVAPYVGSGKYGAHTDRDVARYPYLLVENDRLPLEMQISVVAALGLPVAAVTSSGGRSLHLLVAVNADNEAQFRAIAARLHERLAPFGFDHNGNPSRMTRLPGVSRRDERPTPKQREAARHGENTVTLRGHQILLWLANDQRGAVLPW